MHHGLKSSLVRSWAKELLTSKFSCLDLVCLGTGPKKKGWPIWIRFDRMPIHRQQMLLDRGWLAKLSRSPSSVALRLLCDWNLERVGARPAGLLPGWHRFFFPGDFMAYAVFVEFCSETQCQPRTALFLVQISCSWRDGFLIGRNFDRGAALEFTNSSDLVQARQQ